MISQVKRILYRIKRYSVARKTYANFRLYTMMSRKDYIKYIEFIHERRHIRGNIVECGVWRGGAIAGIASFMEGERTFYLFDSFEGLPEASEIDGSAAKEWQNDVNSKNYYNNCKADIEFAQKAMEKSGKYNESVFIKGWFNETLPENKLQNIAILRLDADWYDSTYICLEHLFDKVIPGGLIILDDYYTWDGCSRALHDFLAKDKRTERIQSLYGGGCYLIKK